MVKNSPAGAGDTETGSIPGLRRSPEGGNSNSLQFLAWKIAWKVEPGGLHSMGLQRFGHD